jgi:hypothetical protein
MVTGAAGGGSGMSARRGGSVGRVGVVSRSDSSDDMLGFLGLGFDFVFFPWGVRKRRTIAPPRAKNE